MISYQPCSQLSKSADITYNNMQSYYTQYCVDWDQSKIVEQISELDNRDILFNGAVVGALRLSFNGEECWIRDLQIQKQFQNRGFAAAALLEATRLALRANASKVKLKVFKISAAYSLYSRGGFKKTSEDDRFYYMGKNIA